MLSIVIPTLNEEKYLPLLLEEIKKQDFDDYEVIVADAGSTDGTVEIAESFGCRVVPGGLPAKGRNEGAKAAKGDIILFTDADNIYLPENFLKDLIGEFEERNLGVASFPILPAGSRLDRIAYDTYTFVTRMSQNFMPHATNSVLVRREVHQMIGGFDEEIKIAEDQDYARRAGKVSKFGFIETEPVLTSARRYESDGRLKTYIKYLAVGIYMSFFGPARSKIFRYDFSPKRFDKRKKRK